MPSKNAFLRNYGFSIVLLASIIAGSCIGLVLKQDAILLKPLGDIFLNLLFAIVVPLVFFSISSAVASIANGKRLGGILGWMMVVFIGTGIISSLVMIFAVIAFPPAQGVHIPLTHTPPTETLSLADQLVRSFTVTDFFELLTKKNMLALMVFSLLIGLSAMVLGPKAKAFTAFLLAGNEVFSKVITFIMYYAPIGLGAYFAYLTGVFGPELLGSYAKSMCIYYPVTLFYFFVFLTFYAFLAGGRWGVKSLWSNIIPASLTGLGTGSSVASIPANMDAAKKIGLPDDVRELVIPLGASVHAEGSCLSAVLKIAFLFGIFNMYFSGWHVILPAVGIALLSGTVMSGIPGGGFLGELMIVTMYGFPPEALPIISMIGTLVDPPATMVNVVGDNVSGMMVARILGGRRWMDAPQPT